MISGTIEVTAYVQYQSSPLAGEELAELLSKFSDNNVSNLVFETDGTYLWTYDRSNARLLITLAATGSQAAAGQDYSTRFVANGTG